MNAIFLLALALPAPVSPCHDNLRIDDLDRFSNQQLADRIDALRECKADSAMTQILFAVKTEAALIVMTNRMNHYLQDVNLMDDFLSQPKGKP